MKIMNTNVSCMKCFFILQLLLITACSPEENHTADWPLYGRDYSNQRFSPLDQINLENVNQLKLAWHYQADYGVNAPSVSYAINGKHYIAVAAGGDKVFGYKTGDEILVFVLDD